LGGNTSTFFLTNNLLIHSSAEQYDNMDTKDPLLNEITQRPEVNSPCIDAGMDKLMWDGIYTAQLTTDHMISVTKMLLLH
jgi:hypothetical protein